jgi:hypothetical protein
LVFGKDMIYMNVQHTANWEYIRVSKQRFIKKIKTKKSSSPSYLSRHDKVMKRKGAGNKYELPCCGSHKKFKVITNETERLRFGFLTDTINIVKYEMTFNGSHKILKVITNGTVLLHFGFLTDMIKIDVSNPKKKLLLHSWG